MATLTTAYAWFTSLTVGHATHWRNTHAFWASHAEGKLPWRRAALLSQRAVGCFVAWITTVETTGTSSPGHAMVVASMGVVVHAELGNVADTPTGMAFKVSAGCGSCVIWTITCKVPCTTTFMATQNSRGTTWSSPRAVASNVANLTTSPAFARITYTLRAVTSNVTNLTASLAVTRVTDSVGAVTSNVANFTTSFAVTRITSTSTHTTTVLGTVTRNVAWFVASVAQTFIAACGYQRTVPCEMIL